MEQKGTNPEEVEERSVGCVGGSWRCFWARRRRGPQEAMYGCLCLYRPQLCKATVLFTVKGCDGPSTEKEPLCPAFCVDVCVYMSGSGGGWAVYLVQNSEDGTVSPSKTCLSHLGQSMFACVCVYKHRDDLPNEHTSVTNKKKKKM